MSVMAGAPQAHAGIDLTNASPERTMPTRDTTLRVVASICASGALNRALRATASRAMRAQLGTPR
ncbi:hypothetical protein LBW60_03800 [Ralstonia solanacearum]|nr:hypothetical protein [Ralstonia solanacearum]MDB0508191.1 hypothetical protein [Ralstonia solanacearum]MDB0512463.1 hypothetical protein [Ralstonia solanacearum]